MKFSAWDNMLVDKEDHHHGGQPLVGPSVAKADSIKCNETHSTWCKKFFSLRQFFSLAIFFPDTTRQSGRHPTGDTEECEEPSDEIAVGRPSFRSIVGVGRALEWFFWQLHKSLVRCLLNNLGQNCMRRCKDSILFGEYLVKAASTLSTWDWPLWKKGWNDVLKKSNLLKRETIRTTGGRMIILDMIPTLISYNNECFYLEIWEIQSICTS